MMRFFISFLSLVFLWPCMVQAQKLPEIDALNRVILNHKDSIVYAHVLPADDHKKIRANEAYKYYWYASHDIKITRGGFDGKLLHGQYTEFYDDKELKVKGFFKKGLKTGTWKTWYRNGQLQDVVTYKKGFKHGAFRNFDDQGNINLKGKYKKDKLKGKLYRYSADTDKPVTVSYKNGKEVASKEKTKKTKSGKQVDSTATSKKFLGIIKLKKTKKKEKAKTKSKEKKINPDKKQKKGKKEPKIRVRRSIKVVPQTPQPTT